MEDLNEKTRVYCSSVCVRFNPCCSLGSEAGSTTELRIEVRGARGQFYLNRLDGAEFTFRKSIAGGHSIGDAAELAMDSSADFDPGQALAALNAAQFITGINRDRE
jgi:hypothetical protein